MAYNKAEIKADKSNLEKEKPRIEEKEVKKNARYNVRQNRNKE